MSTQQNAPSLQSQSSELLDAIVGALSSGVPFLLVLIGSSLVLSMVDWRLRRSKSAGQSFHRPLIMLSLTLIAFVGGILALPIEPATKGNLLTLMGLLLTAVIGLASTTFISNAMAGMLLRSLGKIKPGDFVHADDHFGRVTERGLFHTEVQTEESDLVTLPNFFLVTRPIKVIRAEGTVIFADVSLGYDTDEHRVRTIMQEAAEQSGLRETYSHVRDLGDFSVTYRTAGVLDDPTKLLSARSGLRIAMMNALHSAGIEIASPTIMLQRPLPSHARVMPEAVHNHANERDEGNAERVAFEKANRAAFVEQLRDQVDEIDQQLSSSDDEITDARRESLELRKTVLASMIDAEDQKNTK